MDDCFATVISGYRSEMPISDSMLENLPLLIQAVNMENIIDEFEVAKRNGKDVDWDDEPELLYLAKCIEDDIPYKGFFHEIYSPESPFQYEE